MRRYGFIVTDDEQLYLGHRHPTAEEQSVIDGYRDRYEQAVGHPPHGLHYLPFPGQPDTVGVWLPLTTATTAPVGSRLQ
jgi:hypothetical protein